METETRPRRTWMAYARFGVALAAALASAYLHYRREDPRAAELVQTASAQGHEYRLYYHRVSRHYNTITRDGERVFDSREFPALAGCLQELRVEQGLAFRQCYDAGKDRIIRERLP